MDSATATELRGGSYWSLEAHLLDDLRIVLTGSKDRPAKPHPLRVLHKRAEPSPERRRRLAAARVRARARRRAIEAGEIT